MRPRIGEAPPVETAITSGLRSTIEGMMKSEIPGRSATLTSAPADFAIARAEWVRRSSSVAMKQSEQPTKSSAAGSRGSWRKFGCARNSRNSSLSSRANAMTCAPERTRSSARRAATTPPPTTSAGRSRMSTKIGKSRITLARSGLPRAPAGARPARRTRSSPGPGRPESARSARSRRSARPRDGRAYCAGD